MAKLINKTKNLNITNELTIATGFVQRIKGLMFKEHLNKNEALLIPCCNSIHTFFMNFPIDVVFLNKKAKVQKLVRAVGPNRILLPVLTSSQVLELQSGSIDQFKIEVGDILNVES